MLALAVLWGLSTNAHAAVSQSTQQTQIVATSSALATVTTVSMPIPSTWGGIKAVYNAPQTFSGSVGEGVLPTDHGRPPLMDPPDFIKKRAEQILKGHPGLTTNIYIAGVPSGTIVSQANSWLNVKYVYGGNSRSGIDCSHLVYQVYQGSGIKSYPYLTTAQMATYSHFICVPWCDDGGDIVLFSRLSHCGIYVGYGWMVDANSGYGKVMYDYIWSSYWSQYGPYAVRYTP